MKQSRSTSLLKSVISTGVGFGISLMAQWVFLPLLGVSISLHQNITFAIIMTAISIARGYALERVFEFFGMRIKLSPFVQAVLFERQRQSDGEGWDAAHDDAHPPGELGVAGASYLLSARSLVQGHAPDSIQPPQCWPWERHWFKPTAIRRDLVKGCALGIAEGERHDRSRKSKRKAV